MELHDNHIWISRSILQVLQSLSRDNHGIFVSLVLFETWLCYVSKLQFFSLWEPAHFPPTPPPILPGHSDDLKPVTLVLSPRPRTLVRRKQKCRCTLLLPEEQSTPPTHLRNRARATHTAEKLQFVRITSVWTPSMLSCLQVNLSWGICHGSSCFCI